MLNKIKNDIARFLLVGFFATFISCTAGSQHTIKPGKEGRIRSLLRFYDEKRDTALVLFTDIWYSDSIVVQKITGRHSKTIDNKTTITYPLLRYTCMDITTMTAYDYHAFSDTAIPFRKYPLTDSLRGGWAFYASRFTPLRDSLHWLADTVMNEVPYRRAAFEYFYPPDHYRKIIGFFRCDISDTMFMLERQVSRMVGCPMVIMHDYGPNRPDYYAAIDLLFLSDTLTTDERNVLLAWRRNAEKK